MKELAVRYIGKEVVIYMVSSGYVTGIIEEVSDNAAVIETKGEKTVINLDYVIKMKEYPKNKNGKKKKFVS